MQRSLPVLIGLAFVLLGCAVATLFPPGAGSSRLYDILTVIGIASSCAIMWVNRRLVARRLSSVLGEYRREWKRTWSARLIVSILVCAIVSAWLISVMANG